MSVELQAMELAKRYFAAQGYDVEDVSRKRGHNGYDLVITSNDEILTVEVKGCSREWHIPDPFCTEFDDDKRLVADKLCVIYLLEGCPPSVCLIPRDAIPPEHVKPKHGYRIGSAFKKKAILEQYWSELPPD